MVDTALNGAKPLKRVAERWTSLSNKSAKHNCINEVHRFHEPLPKQADHRELAEARCQAQDRGQLGLMPSLCDVSKASITHKRYEMVGKQHQKIPLVLDLVARSETMGITTAGLSGSPLDLVMV